MTFWAAGATVVAGLGSAYLGSKAAGEAGDAAEEGARYASRADLAAYAQSRRDTAHLRQVGGYALDAYARAMGLNPYNPDDDRYNQMDPAFEDMLGEGVNSGAYAAADPSKLVPTGRYSDGGRQIMVDPETGYGYVMAVQGGNAGAPVPIGARVPGYEPQRPQRQAFLGGSATNPSVAGDPNDRYGGFYASPGYKFTLDQALEGVERSAGAGGYLPSGPGSLSGRFSKEMSRYAAGLASGEFGNYMSRLGTLAGIGGTASVASGNAALETGAQVGSNRISAGNARATSIMNQGNAWGGALGSLGQAGVYVGGYLSQPNYQRYTGYNPAPRFTTPYDPLENIMNPLG